MPYRPNTPCRHPGCAALVPYGQKYCEKPNNKHIFFNSLLSQYNPGSFPPDACIFAKTMIYCNTVKYKKRREGDRDGIRYDYEGRF